MIRFYIFCLAMALVHSISAKTELEDVALELTEKLEQRSIQNVAILNFEGLNSDDELFSKSLTEDFSVYFLNASSTLKVYEREQLGKVITELKLQHSGLIESSTAKELGAFTGAEAIIHGQYTTHQNQVKLWLKVVETESAYQIAALTAEFKYDTPFVETPKVKPEPSKGQIEFKNRSRRTIEVLITSGDYSKKVTLGRNTKLVLPNLVEGAYTCEAKYYGYKDSFESIDIQVHGRQKSRHIFKYVKPSHSWWSLWTFMGRSYL